jgi:hypothetical protein
MKNKLNKLLEYIDEEFEFEPILDYKVCSIEEEMQNVKEGLKDEELKDSWDSMEESIKDLEKFKGKEYSCIFCTDFSSFFIGHAYVIFDKDFKYIDKIYI